MRKLLGDRGAAPAGHRSERRKQDVGTVNVVHHVAIRQKRTRSRRRPLWDSKKRPNMALLYSDALQPEGSPRFDVGASEDDEDQALSGIRKGRGRGRRRKRKSKRG